MPMEAYEAIPACEAYEAIPACEAYEAIPASEVPSSRLNCVTVVKKLNQRARATQE